LTDRYEYYKIKIAKIKTRNNLRNSNLSNKIKKKNEHNMS